MLPSQTHASLKFLIEFIRSSNCLQILQANADTLILFAESIFTSSHTSPLYLIKKEFFQLSAVATGKNRLVEDFLLLSSFSVEMGALGGVPSKKKLMDFCHLGGIMFAFSFLMFEKENLKTN